MFEHAVPLGDVLLSIDLDIDGPSGLAGGAVGAFLTTLVIGGVLVVLAPDYTERTVSEVFDDPVTSFIYGFLFLLLLALVVFGLVITIIGILLAIPLVLVAYLVWAVGATIGFLAIGDRLVGHEDDWVKPLLVAAAINGALALTGIGGIISFLVGATGFGTILREYVG